MVSLDNAQDTGSSLRRPKSDQHKSGSFNEHTDMKLDEYEPYDHGNTDHALQRPGALFHLVKYIMGTYILAIPFAIKNVGYLTGIIGTLLVGLLYAHIIHMLLDVEYELCKRLQKPNLTYITLVENVFKTGPKQIRYLGPYFHFITYFNYVVLYTVGDAGYLLVMGGNLKGLYDGYYDVDSDIKNFLLGLTIPLLILCLIPKLKFLVPFSVLTSFFTLFNGIVILAIPVPKGTETGTPKAVNDIFFFPQFFAMMLASLTATGLMLPIKNDMKEPKGFGSLGGVLNISMAIVTAAYAGFGFLCYMKYGDMIQGNVLLNLPKGELLPILVYSLYTLAVGVSYTLCFYIVFDTIWSNYLNEKMSNRSSKYKFIVKYGLKMFINIMAYVIAVALPNFELYSSLFGTLAILIDLCVPPVLHIIVLSTRKGVSFIILKDALIIILSLSLFIGGLSGTIIDIITFYNK